VTRYCWLHSTYTEAGLEPGDSAHPGVGPGRGHRRWQAHYQWVPLYLALLAALLAGPHLVWRAAEGGRLAKLLAVAEGHGPGEEDTELARGARLEALADWLAEGSSRGPEEPGLLERAAMAHAALCLPACEAACLAVVVGELVLTDRFLAGAFRGLGAEWLAEGREPLARAFPKVTKCDFRMYGPSGGLQTVDALCVLGINALNEKIFLALWFWLHLLLFLSSLQLLLRLALLLFPPLRARLLLLHLLLRGADRQGLELPLTCLAQRLPYSTWLQVTPDT
jgi:hypothetical protein